MATSELKIVNSAIVKIGAYPLLSDLDGTDKKTIICKEQYPKARDYVLEAFPWKFASKRISLALDVDTPAFEYDYQFTLPTDLLRILATDLDKNEPWVREGSLLLCNQNSINIKYTSQITDTTKFSKMYEEVVALWLGADLAYSISQSSTLQKALYDAYNAKLREARSINSQEGDEQLVASDVDGIYQTRT